MVQKKLPLINSEHGSETRNIINELIKIFNGMGYTYNEALQKAHDILNEAKQTNDMNESVQQQINTLIAESGTSDAEVLQARTDLSGYTHDVLKQRLDHDRTKLDRTESELSNNLKESTRRMNNELNSIRERKPLITIIDDDGNKAVNTKWLPILQDKYFKLDIAVITEMPDNNDLYLDWEEIKNLKDNYNVDILSHTHKHPDLDTLNESELRVEFENSLNALNLRGYYSDILVYPRGISLHETRKVASEYFRGAVFDMGGMNIPPIYTYNLRRHNMFESTEKMKSLDALKALVDDAIEQNGWLVLMSHSQFSGFNSQTVLDFVDYVNSKNIEWVHTAQGYDRFGNIVQIGDNEDRYEGGEPSPVKYPYRIIDMEGNAYSNIDESIHNLGDTGYNYNTLLDEYPRGKYSYAYINNSNPSLSSFPESGGMLETFHAVVPSFSYQKYKPSISNEIYLRRWNGVRWTEFERASNVNIKKSGVGFSTSIVQFPENKVTYSTIINSAQGYSNFPDGSGILKTVRIDSTTFGYQQYMPRSNSKIYQRSWNGSDWTIFEMVGEENPVSHSYLHNSPPSAYPTGKVTTGIFQTSVAGDLPEGAGVLTTYRHGGYQYNYQVYKPIASSSLYIRTAVADGSSWVAFIKQ